MLTIGKPQSRSYSRSAWPAYETCLSRRTVVARPAHYTGGYVEVSLSSVQRTEQFPPPKPHLCCLCPLLSCRIKGFRIALGRRIPASHFSLCDSILWVAGVPVRRRPNTRQVMLWAVLLLSCRLTSLQQTGLEMVPCSTNRRRSEVGAHSWMQGVLSIQRMFGPFDQIRSSEHNVLCGEFSTAALRTSFLIFRLTQKGYSAMLWWHYHSVGMTFMKGFPLADWMLPRWLEVCLFNPKMHLSYSVQLFIFLWYNVMGQAVKIIP